MVRPIQEKKGLSKILARTSSTDALSKTPQTSTKKTKKVKKKEKVKCKGTTSANKRCYKCPLDDSAYCRAHEYMENYIEEMKKNLGLCKKCRTMRYIVDKDKKRCEKCQVIECKKLGCSNKKSVENDYCMLHQLQVFIDDVEREGKKTCYGVLRGCRARLRMDYPKSKCEDCLSKDRKKDKEKRTKRKSSNKKAKEKLICVKCGKTKKKYEFINGHGILGDKCSECLKAQNEYTRKRIRKVYRKGLLQDYKKGATRRNLKWNLSDKKAMEMMKHNCHYCGHICKGNNEEYNGIDRIDSDEGYEDENVVSSCSRCNRAKNEYSFEEFMTYCGNVYKNYPCEEESDDVCTYMRYCAKRTNAKRRCVDLNLTREQYEHFMTNKCYYCASSNIKGKIGIDRKSSLHGYSMENCVTCCEICNTMKREMGVMDFHSHILKILLHNKKITQIDYHCKKMIEEDSDEITSESLKERLERYHCDRDSNKCQMDYKMLTEEDNRKKYDKMIFNESNVENISPIMEFVSDIDELDMWEYYCSTFEDFVRYEPSSDVCNVKILVKDDMTDKYIGIIELDSDTTYLAPLYKELKWSARQNHIKRKSSVFAITTIKPLGTLKKKGGEALLIKLLFSLDVCKNIYKRHNIVPACFVRLFTEGKRNIIYNDLKEMKYLNKTDEEGLLHIDKKTIAFCDKFLKDSKIEPQYQTNHYRVLKVCEHLKIQNVLRYGKSRTVYYGCTSSDSVDYLRNKTGKMSYDLISRKKDILEDWKERFMNYDDNYAFYDDRKEYDRMRKRREYDLKRSNRDKNSIKERNDQQMENYYKQKGVISELDDTDIEKILNYVNSNLGTSMFMFHRKLKDHVGKKFSRAYFYELMNKHDLTETIKQEYEKHIKNKKNNNKNDDDQDNTNFVEMENIKKDMNRKKTHERYVKYRDRKLDIITKSDEKIIIDHVDKHLCKSIRELYYDIPDLIHKTVTMKDIGKLIDKYNRTSLRKKAYLKTDKENRKKKARDKYTEKVKKQNENITDHDEEKILNYIDNNLLMSMDEYHANLYTLIGKTVTFSKIRELIKSTGRDVIRNKLRRQLYDKKITEKRKMERQKLKKTKNSKDDTDKIIKFIKENLSLSIRELHSNLRDELNIKMPMKQIVKIITDHNLEPMRKKAYNNKLKKMKNKSTEKSSYGVQQEKISIEDNKIILRYRNKFPNKSLKELSKDLTELLGKDIKTRRISRVVCKDKKNNNGKKKIVNACINY